MLNKHWPKLPPTKSHSDLSNRVCYSTFAPPPQLKYENTHPRTVLVQLFLSIVGPDFLSAKPLHGGFEDYPGLNPAKPARRSCDHWRYPRVVQNTLLSSAHAQYPRARWYQRKSQGSTSCIFFFFPFAFVFFFPLYFDKTLIQLLRSSVNMAQRVPGPSSLAPPMVWARNSLISSPPKVSILF